MAAQIKPGQWITLTVKKNPRATAKVKTLVRLFEKDPTVRKERARLSKTRIKREHRRGGRQWQDIPPQLKVVDTDKGTSHRILASLDVLKDIASLGDCVEVAPAK